MTDITMYSKQWCPYCRAARATLDARGLEYNVIEITGNQQALEEMLDKAGRHTVPQIFFGDEHIGGFDDLQLYFRDLDSQQSQSL